MQEYPLSNDVFLINSHITSSTQTKKTPVVCIHGFGGNADQFRKNIPVFADNGHSAYAIDLLGYGEWRLSSSMTSVILGMLTSDCW